MVSLDTARGRCRVVQLIVLKRKTGKQGIMERRTISYLPYAKEKRTFPCSISSFTRPFQ